MTQKLIKRKPCKDTGEIGHIKVQDIRHEKFTCLHLFTFCFQNCQKKNCCYVSLLILVRQPQQTSRVRQDSGSQLKTIRKQKASRNPGKIIDCLLLSLWFIFALYLRHFCFNAYVTKYGYPATLNTRTALEIDLPFLYPGCKLPEEKI